MLRVHAHQLSHYYIQATCLLIHPSDSFQFHLPCGPFKQLLILCLHTAFRLPSAAPIDARRRYSASVGRTTLYLQLNVHQCSAVFLFVKPVLRISRASPWLQLSTAPCSSTCASWKSTYQGWLVLPLVSQHTVLVLPPSFPSRLQHRLRPTISQVYNLSFVGPHRTHARIAHTHARMLATTDRHRDAKRTPHCPVLTPSSWTQVLRP